MLAPTPPDKLVDPQGRPYFLWDMEMTLDGKTREFWAWLLEEWEKRGYVRR